MEMTELDWGPTAFGHQGASPSSSEDEPPAHGGILDGLADADGFAFTPLAGDQAHDLSGRASLASVLDASPTLAEGLVATTALRGGAPVSHVIETLTVDHVPSYRPDAAPHTPVASQEARGGWPGAEAPAAAAPDDIYTSGQGGFGVESDFNITLVFRGDMPDDLRDDFILAAEYLSTLITGDLPNRGRVDDIVILAEVSDIDGPGQVLGQAGPLGWRKGSDLPFAGTMEFDVADAQQLDEAGQFDDTVIHEMMHCLGFGTLWEQMGLLEGSIRGDDLRFVGENAMLAYPVGRRGAYEKDPGRADGVPVETDYGPGTAGGHWDEELFTSELMTGFINPRAGVSPVTVAALEDMGYETVFDPRNPGQGLPQPGDLLLLA